jgi:hypothetical protein
VNLKGFIVKAKRCLVTAQKGDIFMLSPRMMEVSNIPTLIKRGVIAPIDNLNIMFDLKKGRIVERRRRVYNKKDGDEDLGIRVIEEAEQKDEEKENKEKEKSKKEKDKEEKEEDEEKEKENEKDKDEMLSKQIDDVLKRLNKKNK